MSENDHEKEWRQFTLGELREIQKSLKEIHGEISALKVKSGVWGLAAGSFPVIVMIAVNFLRGKIKGEP